MSLNEFVMSMAFAVQNKMHGEVGVFPQTVRKNNGVIWQGLTFKKKDCKVAPTIYLEAYYEAYKEGVSLECLAQQIVECYGSYGGHPEFEPDFFRNYEEVRGRIVYKLVNYHQNRKLLSEIPHLPFLDLAIVFYCLVSHSEIGMASILIRDSHVKMWEINQRTLYEDAKENTPALLRPEFRSMCQVLKLPLEELRDGPILHVLTNEEHMNGAACLLYEGVLESCAKQLNTSYFLLPSSIHEVLLLPYDRSVEITSLRAIVKEANQTQVEPHDRLSDSVYFYSREEKKLIIL